MDLKTFVSETLIQIVEGVSEAQKRIRESGSNASVNPHQIASEAKQKIGQATPVEFDVALVVAEESQAQSGSKAGGSVGFLSVVTTKVSAELSEQSSGSNKTEAVSRIRFSVRLAQPADLSEYSTYIPSARRNMVV